MVRINFGVYLYSHTKSARENNRDINATMRRSGLAKNIENQRTPSLSLVRLSRQPDAHSARPTQASRIYDTPPTGKTSPQTAKLQLHAIAVKEK